MPTPKDTHELINAMRLELKGDIKDMQSRQSMKFDSVNQSIKSLEGCVSNLRVQITENKVRLGVLYGAVAVVVGAGSSLFVNWII